MECDLAFFWMGLAGSKDPVRGDPFSLIPLEGRNEDVLVGHFGRLKFSWVFFFL